MLWLYNIGITFYKFLLICFAPFNPKAKLFLKGRENIFKIIEDKTKGINRPVWFHFASLGEFEQGRPVLEQIRKKYPKKGIIITFFSPSGYEIRKNYDGADAVFYLPLDTKSNAMEFIRLVNPEIAIFTKYEFWYHYFAALHHQHIPLIIISVIFRREQIFFRWYGSLHRKMLGFVAHFFVQNQESVGLLKEIGLANVSLSGDTRFDRVAENAAAPRELPLISSFCNNSRICIVGSSWPQDELLLRALCLQYPQWKFIIAPHEINPAHLQEIMKLFPQALKYTALQHQRETTSQLAHVEQQLQETANTQVLVIDNIGMLSSIYQYGHLAYIGGGFGAGIHNTLEAAAFGLPLIFGPKYAKFQEARELIELGAALSITSYEDLSAAFEKLRKDEHAGEAARKYVTAKTGATAQIVDYIALMPGLLPDL